MPTQLVKVEHTLCSHGFSKWCSSLNALKNHLGSFKKNTPKARLHLRPIQYQQLGVELWCQSVLNLSTRWKTNQDREYVD